MTTLSMDLKMMPRSHRGFNFIFVVTEKVTIPIDQSRSEEMDDTLMEHVFCKCNIPECMVMDQNNALMSTLIYYLFNIISLFIQKVRY